jgi:hypothetical protein
MPMCHQSPSDFGRRPLAIFLPSFALIGEGAGKPHHHHRRLHSPIQRKNQETRNTKGYHLLDLWARKTSEEDVRTGTSGRFHTECNEILVLAGNALLQAAAPPVS